MKKIHANYFYTLLSYFVLVLQLTVNGIDEFDINSDNYYIALFTI